MSVFSFPIGFALYLLFVTFVFGLVFGSFCNAWAWRIAHHEKITRGRSHCPNCGHTLGVLDLVPLFSYLFLRGKCRYCKKKISPRYPVTELILGLYFVSVVLVFGFSWETLRLLIMGALLLTLSLVDIDTMIIPDGFMLALLLTAPLRLLTDPSSWKSMLIGFFAVSVPLLILVLIMDKVWKKDSMGGGDIKLLAVLGAHFGAASTLLLLILACIFGLIGAKLAKKRKGTPFPFGPMLSIAAWVTVFLGPPVIRWYLSLF